MIEVNGENYQKQKEITDNIDRLLQEIEDETGLYSTMLPTLEHRNFKILVEIGDKIIPYLFYKMFQQGNSWTYFLLLQEITKQNPISKEHAGSFYHHIMYWLQWYIDSKYFKHDVYYNLLNDE